MQICRAPLRNKLHRPQLILKQLSTPKPISTTNRKMAFFQRNFYAPEATSFTPLFRLLEDFDNYSRQDSGHQHGRRPGLPHWQPKFDVRETESAYELHGELPGMTKDNVHIEFTDPQSMFIRGKAERTYTSGTPPAGALTDNTMSGAITEGGEEQTSSGSRNATVEDEAEEGTSATPSGGEVAKSTTQKPTQKPTDTAKYWLTERSIGEFSRTFNFPTRVNQDSVTASFKDGIINIVVPKAAKHEPRRIAVN